MLYEKVVCFIYIFQNGRPCTGNMKPPKKVAGTDSPPPPSLSPQPILPATTGRKIKLPLRQVHIGSVILAATDSLLVSALGLSFKLQCKCLLNVTTGSLIC